MGEVSSFKSQISRKRNHGWTLMVRVDDKYNPLFG
jgi:hypothetical protein